MNKVWGALAALVLGASLALAQQAPVPAAPDPAPTDAELQEPETPEAPETNEEPQLGSEADSPQQAAPQPSAQTGQAYQILVIGDALAGGLFGGLSRLSEAGKPVVPTNRINEVSGLARPDFYDWPQALVKITEGKNFDTAVVLIGSNDRREFRSSAGRFAFNTPEWKQAYGAQIDALVNVLKARNINIFWVGMPPMADPAYDADVQMINAIAKERAEALGITYVDIRPDFLNPDGTYTDRGLDEAGVSRKMRSRDGVGFFKVGNTKMAQLVLTAISAKTVDKAFVDSAKAAPADAPALAPVVAGPTLGQDADGQVIVTESKDIEVAVAALNKDLGLAKDKAIATGTAITAKKDSMSARMLTTGEPPPSLPGRFDDASSAQ
jgi:uncharacterized protein